MSNNKSPTLIQSVEASSDLPLQAILNTLGNSTEERPADEGDDLQVSPAFSKFRLSCIIIGLCLSLFLVVLDFV